MTRSELNEIKQAIMQSQMEVAMQMEEVWLSKDEFLKQFQMFTEDWLKRYGETLPRTPAIVLDKDGVSHSTRMAYPRNKIQAMIRDGSIKKLKCYKVKVVDSKAAG